MIAERFRLLRLLGQGGFAAVFEARDEKLEQLVAVKILKSPDDTEFRAEQLQRFEREAKLAAKISHPDIIRTIDIGQWESTPYIVMEKLDGHPLSKELWRSGSLEHERIHKLMSGALHALAAAHEQGVIHRDIKPANLFVSHPGTRLEALKILDFGIAFHFSHLEERLTGTQDIIGTPSFISPEYARSRTISPSIDVYQIGLVLAEMLHGERITRRSKWECYLADELWKPVELPEYLLAGPFGQVLEKSLAEDPERRYPNAGVMLQDFELIELQSSTPQPVALPPTQTYERAPEDDAWTDERSLELDGGSWRQLALGLGVGTILMVLLAALAGVVWFTAGQDEPDAAREVSATVAPREQDMAPPSAEPAHVDAVDMAAEIADEGARAEDMARALAPPKVVKKKRAGKRRAKDKAPSRDKAPEKNEAPARTPKETKGPDQDTREALDWLKSSE